MPYGRGDAAVRELTERFDGVVLDDLRVPSDELRAAAQRCAPGRCETRSSAQPRASRTSTEQLRSEAIYERDGIVVRDVQVPVDRAGLLRARRPGASIPSTVLMTAVPARVAGVRRDRAVRAARPPTGRCPTSTLAAAAIAGRRRGLPHRRRAGHRRHGLRHRDRSAPVDVIVGPGNVYVARGQARGRRRGSVGVPSAFAGPSEVVVVADDTAPPELAAIDVIVQAEHGPDGLAWLITWSTRRADAIDAAIDRLVGACAPPRPTSRRPSRQGGYAGARRRARAGDGGRQPRSPPSTSS